MGMNKRRSKLEIISITDKAVCRIFFRIMEAYVKYLFNNYY